MKMTTKFITILFASLSFCTISLAMQKKEMTVGEQKTFFAKVKKNDSRYVQRMYVENYNLDIQDKKTQRTALHVAAEQGHTDLCKDLLSCGVDHTIQDKDGKTAQQLAKKTETIQIFKEWLRKQEERAKPAAEAAASRCASTSSSTSSSTSNMDYSPFNPEINRLVEASPLQVALFNNDNERAQKLLLDMFQQKIDINCNFIGSDMRPIDYALVCKQWKIVKLLLDNGANCKAGQTCCPLVLAIHDKNIEIIDLLIKQGADVNEYCPTDGVTPLIEAVKQGSLEIVQRLLAAGANIALPKKIDRKLALEIASEKKDIPIVAALFVASNNHLQQHRGTSPLADQIADIAAAAAAVNMLTSSSSASSMQPAPNARLNESLEQQLFTALANKNAQKAIELIQDPAINLDEQDLLGFTPLYYAVDSNLLNVVKALVDKGCSVNKLLNGKEAKNKEKIYYPAIHVAIVKDREEIVDYFLSLVDLEVNLADTISWMTPLMYAVYKANMKTVRSLLEHPAIDVNLPNIGDQTALDMALNKQFDEIQKLLEAKGAKTYLMINVEKKAVQAVKVLCDRIKKGENRACLKHKDPVSNKTVLEKAREIGNKEIITLIEEAAAAV